jgi:hypothetical protein
MRYAFIVVGMLLFVARADAALVLDLDTANETFYFTGSDTGTAPDDLAILGTWQVNSNYSGPAATLSQANVTSFNGVSENNNDFAVVFSGNTISDITLQMLFPQSIAGTSGTLTANPSVVTSYASLTPSQQAAFESELLDPSFVLSFKDNLGATGFSAIQVVEVPEPGTSSLLAMAAAVYVLMSMRRRLRRLRVHPQC